MRTSGSLICEIPVHERPRERLERLGAESLKDAELLAILLRTGRRGMSSVELGEVLLKRFGNLKELGSRSVAEIARVAGIGKAKAVTLKAAFALQQRVARGTEQMQLDHPAQIYEYMIEQVRFLKAEVLFGLALDSKLRLIHCYEITRGLLNQTLVHAREVFREAISSSAAHLILVHNHPSGDPTPSSDDIRSTREVLQAGKVLGIPLLDHVIVGRTCSSNHRGYVSLKEMGIFS